MSELTGGDIEAVVSEMSEPATGDASPASDPGTVDPSTPAPVAATVPPSSEPPESSTDPASAGPIPFDRHKAALDNARTKAREEADAAWRERVGWAEQIPREQLEHWTQTARQMSSDPVGFLQQFAAELQSHPVYGPQLKSHAARVLGQRGGGDDAEPQADLQTEDGTPVFSAKRLAEWHAWNARQLEQKFNERLAPLQETHAQVQQARQRELLTQASDQFAKREMDAVKALPHFEEFKAEIKAKFAAMPPPEHPLAYGAMLRDAYLQVVIPQLSQKERSAVLADFKARGSASTASPSRPSASAPIPDAQRPIEDLLAEEFARIGA